MQSEKTFTKQSYSTKLNDLKCNAYAVSHYTIITLLVLFLRNNPNWHLHTYWMNERYNNSRCESNNEFVSRIHSQLRIARDGNEAARELPAETQFIKPDSHKLQSSRQKRSGSNRNTIYAIVIRMRTWPSIYAAILNPSRHILRS